MKRILFLAPLLLLAGCNPDAGSIASSTKYMPDQKLRAERFDACMKNLPAGPESTHYNDWSEVVDSCESAAYKQSIRLAHQNKKGQWVFENGIPVS